MDLATGKNVRISKEVYDFMKQNMDSGYKISRFVESAIIEKINKEKKTEKVVYYGNTPIAVK
jgi:hypothetical protein